MKFASSHSHRQFLEIQFIWKLVSIINYVFVFSGVICLWIYWRLMQI